jgi:hypothetical protein
MAPRPGKSALAEDAAPFELPVYSSNTPITQSMEWSV